MEIINMKDKVRTGPKSKAPEEIHKAIAHYAPFKEIEEFGGGKGNYDKGIAWAREFAAQTFQKQLAKIRAGKAVPGQF